MANDADIQGAAVVRGKGLELVITLGTGFGTGLFYNGDLMPHLEIAHQPFRKGETYNDQLGEATRKEIGEERWNKRVPKAIANMRALTFFDHLYIGGGNSRRVLRHHLPDDVTVVDNTAGILGGIRLWVPLRRATAGPAGSLSRGSGRRPPGSALPAPPAALDLLEPALPALSGSAAAVRCTAANRSAGSARSGWSAARDSSQPMEKTASCRSPSLLWSRSAALAVLRAGTPFDQRQRLAPVAEVLEPDPQLVEMGVGRILPGRAAGTPQVPPGPVEHAGQHLGGRAGPPWP